MVLIKGQNHRKYVTGKRSRLSGLEFFFYDVSPCVSDTYDLYECDPDKRYGNGSYDRIEEELE